MSAEEVLARYEKIRAEVEAEAERLQDEPRLSSAAEVMAPLAPRRPEQVAESAEALTADSSGEPRTLAESINATLRTILAADRRVVVFGEDVGVKGGVYGVTGGLARTFGAARSPTPCWMSSQSWDLAGAGTGRPDPDAPRSNTWPTCTTQKINFAVRRPRCRSSPPAGFHNPMVVRIAGLAYQKGFGGHFHNDNALGVLSDIPGARRRLPGSRG